MAKDTYGRQRHTSQSYSVTCFGKSLESGPSGYGRRLQGAAPGVVVLQGMVGNATFFPGDATAGSWPLQVINQIANAAALLTLTLFDPNDVGFTPIAVVTAGSLAAVGPLTLIPASMVPITRDLAFRAVITAGASNAVHKLAVVMVPEVADWS